MRLLGNYKSNLTPFQYRKLIDLVAQGVQTGEFAANTTFDAPALQALQKQAQDFSNLAVDSAGQRVGEDSINRPVDLLNARFSALLDEANDFTSKAGLLLSVAGKDSGLIDQLLAAAFLESWAHGKTPLPGADQTKWDYGMGYGSVFVGTDVTNTNPANSVVYDTRPGLFTILDTNDGNVRTGITPPITVSPVKPKNLTWTFTTGGQSSIESGDDWASLEVLEPLPLINFSQTPQVTVNLPIGGIISDYFEVAGVVPGGSVPIMVQILFHPRRNSTTVTVADATAGSLATFLPVGPLDKVFIDSTIQAVGGTNGSMRAELALFHSDGSAVLNADGTTMTVFLPSVSPNTAAVPSSGLVTIPNINGIAKAKLQFTAIGTTVGSWSQPFFRVHLPLHVATNTAPDETAVYVPGGKVYFANQDFVADDSGQVTVLAVADSTVLTVRYTELYPSYQCSVNGIDWSPTVMLDPLRPYPDDEKDFRPVALTADATGSLTRFPVTDELGNITGLTLRMKQAPPNEYLFTVSTPAVGVNPGSVATLQIDFERPSYMTHLVLSPFTMFPCRIDTIETQSFTTASRTKIFTRGTVPGPLLDQPLRIRFPRTLVRTVFLKIYQENYELNEYQQEPPDQLRREALSSLQSALPEIVRSPQQAIPNIIRGAQYDFGIENILGEDWAFQVPSVLVAGPYRLTGCPEVLRFDADHEGSPAYYLCFKGFDASGSTVDENLVGVALTPGSCIAFPWASNANLTLITKADIYLKVVLTTTGDVVQRFMFQTTKV